MSVDTESRPIETEAQYALARKVLEQRSRPPYLLRVLMNAFESYRQARRIGWSRPWNKYGVRTFCSLQLRRERDLPLIQSARSVIRSQWPAAPTQAMHFIDRLLEDPGLMGFIFYSEIEHTSESHSVRRSESVTLSLGRICSIARRHRDRLDIVFDSMVGEDGQSQGLSQVRLYVDPWQGNKEPMWTAENSAAITAESTRVFGSLCRTYTDHSIDPSYVWDHWTSSYIDYFGPREWNVHASPLREQKTEHKASPPQARAA